MRNMFSATSSSSFATPSSSHASSSLFSSKPTFNLQFNNTEPKNHSLQLQSQSQSLSLSPRSPKLKTLTAVTIGDAVIADKLHRLSSEFQSLSEPIDRVKRLLHYAALLPPMSESDRVPENRVKGCTTQVWVVAEIDEFRRMRFRADSDSEISKGFCWCLIWMLNGADADEVMMVETEDLADINVVGSYHVKAKSRVNTWQNVLFSMQKATKALVMEMDDGFGKHHPLQPFTFSHCRFHHNG